MCGTLTNRELAELARELARYDLAALLDRPEGYRTVNPHIVTVGWGAKHGTLNLDPGESLPLAMRWTYGGRMSGIVAAVKRLAK